jgi:hypothetical protein
MQKSTHQLVMLYEIKCFGEGTHRNLDSKKYITPSTWRFCSWLLANIHNKRITTVQRVFSFCVNNIGLFCEIWGFKPMQISTVVFQVMAPCSQVDSYKHFKETCRIHLQGEIGEPWKEKQYVSQNRWYPPASVHGTITQKTISFPFCFTHAQCLHPQNRS